MAMILRCTGKLLKLLGQHPAALAETQPEESRAEWYANLLWFDRRKCLLVTHAETLFSMFFADVRKSDLSPIGLIVIAGIREALLVEGLPPGAFGNLDHEHVQIAKTTSRVVLGCMNDLAFYCEHAIARAGGLAHCDLAALNRGLRRSINSPTGYAYPIDLVRALGKVDR